MTKRTHPLNATNRFSSRSGQQDSSVRDNLSRPSRERLSGEQKQAIDRLLDPNRYCGHWGNKNTLLIQVLLPTDTRSNPARLKVALDNIFQSEALSGFPIGICDMVQTDGILGISIPQNALEAVTSILYSMRRSNCVQQHALEVNAR